MKCKIYLVICNISKRPNVRSLLTTAAAFGCYGVFIVGQKSFNIDPDGPDIPGSIKHYVRVVDKNTTNNINNNNNNNNNNDNVMFLQRFEKWKEFVEYIRDVKIRLIGVEIHKDAQLVDHYLLKGADGVENCVDTAFVMGNEGQGLSEHQLTTCDGFVRIPQYGNGTASLNVNVAASIILQRVYQWQYQEEPTTASITTITTATATAITE